MPGIYNYISETNHVSRVFVLCCSWSVFTICVTCNVISSVKCVLHFYISIFWNMCAVPIMAVFCYSLISRFPGMLLRHCLSDFEMIPVAPINIGITFAFTFHMRWISIMRSLHIKIFSASFLIIFLSLGFATSINRHVQFLLSRIMMSDLLLVVVYYYYYYYYYYYHHHHHSAGRITPTINIANTRARQEMRFWATPSLSLSHTQNPVWG
jgi:hypothetical protein